MVEKTSESYWSQLWTEAPVPRPIDANDSSLRNHVRLAFAELFRKHLGDGHGRQLIELGCARSIWLPFFGRDLKWQVYGMDYSEVGCQQSRQMLRDVGLSTEIFCIDFLKPPAHLTQKFDAVVSMGLMEHFTDTTQALAAAASLARSGGLMVTTIPNMRGLPGLLQKWFDRETYHIHVPLSRDELHNAHLSAGLEVIDSGYLMFNNFSALAGPKSIAGKCLMKGLVALSVMTWVLERLGLAPKPNGLTSPYIYCVARRKVAN